MDHTIFNTCVYPLHIKSRDKHSFRYFYKYLLSRFPTGNEWQTQIWITGGGFNKGALIKVWMLVEWCNNLESVQLRGTREELAAEVWRWRVL